MKIDIFIESLLNAAPSADKLKNIGFSTIEAEEFRETFTCQKRVNPVLITDDSDIFFVMLRDWDLSRVVIGMVCFYNTPTLSENGWVVGTIESDLLVIKEDSKEIVVIEHETNDHLLWHCAENSMCFLEALILAADFLGKRVVEEIDFDDMGTANSIAKRCAEIAGGEIYLNFYLMLFGIGESIGDVGDILTY